MAKRRTSSVELCPVAWCGGTRARWQAVCRSCFGRLPEDLRGRIVSAKQRRARRQEAAAAIEATAWLNERPPTWKRADASEAETVG